ncbi:LPXTG cell wall anchor domain-containing protein [Microbacterium sp. 2FI]|uniref:LPXTG cell wall anchor domain-containing protein n=1 Tax=Microbacterium sp. 2FI TaxID=2502193 RepID=UPI0010F4903B|nr:LPXTG cell wall anchor domain-containing protein [Microbacterium sp. 2FI]
MNMDGFGRLGTRRRMRRERNRDRNLTMRHRWYAGGIATLLTGALIFTGVTPAVAGVVTPPPADETTTQETTPAEETPAEETPAEETPAEEAPAEEAPAEEAPVEEAPAEETPAEEAPAEETPAKPAPSAPKGEKPSSDSSKAAAPLDAPIVALAILPACTGTCLTFTRAVNIVGGGPATAANWEYRATVGADWHVLPAAPATVDAANGSWVISAISQSPNTANYTTAVTCTDAGNGLTWTGGTSTLAYTANADRASTCTFTHTYAPPQSATITVKVGSDRTSITGVTDLQGVVLHLRNDNGSGTAPSATRADGVAGDGAGWARCVSGPTGDCVFTVPATQAGGANNGTRPWVVQYSVPSTHYMNPTLRVGGAAGAGSSLAYQFRMKVGLVGNTSYSSQDVDDLMLGSGTASNVSGGIWQQSRVNPTLTPSCGLDVALILDISGSVGTALPDLKDAADTFVDSLAGTPSRMSLFSFSWETPGSGGATNYPSLTPVTTPGQGTIFKNRYVSWTSAGGTNWDRGLGIAASNNVPGNQFDVAVIITDGNPTTYNQPYQGSGSDNRFRETENGIFSANALKANGTRVLAFGVGAGATGATNALNLRAISGPTAYTGTNGQNADFYQTEDYDAVGTALRNLALGNCAGSLTVTKAIVPSSAPAGSITGAVPAGAGWVFNSTINTAGVTTPDNSQPTTNDGTGSVTFPLTFPGGTTQASITIVEEQQAGFTLVPVNGSNAVCTNLNTGQAVVPTANPTNGVTLNVPSTEAVNCVIYNRAPNPEADLTVSKSWIVNGVPYTNGSQPGGLNAQLQLTGPGAAGATNQGWGVTRTGYTLNNVATISETLSLIDPTMCSNVATITEINGDPANIALGAGYALTLTEQHNTATITNTVTCESRLTLIKNVANGPTAPGAWVLNAQFLAGQPVPAPALPGFFGTSGTTDLVTADARYQLFETSGSPLYTQVDQRTNLQSNPLSTGSASCIRVDENGDPWPNSGYSDGINGGVNVPLGTRVACTITNQTAELTLLKHVINDNGGDAAAGDWTLIGTPVNDPDLPVQPPVGNVVGSETDTGTSSFFVRPGTVYTISETGPDGYEQVKLQRLIGPDTWEDVAGWDVSVPALGDATYRIVNDDIAPKLTLVKTVTNNHGGTAQPTAWTLTATTPEGPDLSGVTGTDPVTAEPVEAGVTYTLGESDIDGYTLASLNCVGFPNTTVAAPTLVLEAGDDVTCTFNNDDEPGNLTLVKVVDDTNGGDAVPADWNQLLEAKRGADATIAFDHNETIAVPAGVYTLNELQSVANYEWTDLECSTGTTSMADKTVTVANGANVTCTFTNIAKKPTLTLVKIVDNQDGVGSRVATDWTLSAAGDGGFVDATLTSGDGGVTASTGPQPVEAETTYTLGEDGPAGGYTASDWTCDSDIVVDDGQISLPIGANVTCEITNTAIPAEYDVDKTVDGAPMHNLDGTWTIVYDIVVTNTSEYSDLFYDLDDALLYGAGITPIEASWSGPDDTDVPFVLPAGTATLATDVELPTAGEGNPPATHTYTVTVIAEIADGTQDTDTWTCTSTASPNRGFLNSATLTVGDDDTTVYACDDPAFPEITKLGTNPASQNGDASWNLEYTITVTNPGDVAIQAELEDAFPAAPAGWTLVPNTWNVVNGVDTPALDADFAPGTATIWSGELPADTTYTFVVTGVLKPSTTATPIGDCAAQGGFLNKATVTSGDIVEDAEGCVTVVLPPVTVSKTDGTVTQLEGGDWQIDYTVTVSNDSAFATVYTLTDTPDLGDGFDVVSSGWSGAAPVANTAIEAGGSDQFVYRIVASFDDTVEEPQLECVEGEGGAFHNIATVTYPGTPGTDEDDGCAEPQGPTVTKTAAVPTPAAGGSWTISYTVTVRNDTSPGIQLAYELHDAPYPLPDGMAITADWAVTGPMADPDGAGSATLNPAWNGDDPTLVAEGVLPAGATHTYTVSVGARLEADIDPEVLLCGEAPALDEGIWNTALVTNGVFEDSAEACVEVMPVPVIVDKADGTVTQLSDGTWYIEYGVTVTNENALPTVYSLTDAPDFDASFDVTDEGWLGDPDVTDVPIDGNDSHQYTYWVEAESLVDPVPASGLACTENGGGFFNVVTVAYPGGTDTDSGCAAPEIPVVDKTAVDAKQNTETGEWTLTYEVAVTNSYDIQLWYSVTDEPQALPADVTGGEWTASGPVATGGGSGALNPDWDGDLDTQLATGVLPAGATHTYEVTRTVMIAASVVDETLDCLSEEEGAGLWNSATVTNGVGGNTDLDCIVIERPLVDIDKDVTDIRQLEGGTWEITYEVLVTNLSSELAAVYDLDDTLYFGADIVIEDAEWSGPSALSPGVFTDPGWTDTLAEDEVLVPSETDTYTVVVHATVPNAAWDESQTLACEDAERPGAGGFLNTAVVTVNGTTIPADDCEEPALPTIEKEAVSALQVEGDASRWNVEYLVTVTSGGFDTFYDLSDTPAFASGIDIVGGTAQLLPDGDVEAITAGVDFASAVALPADAVHEYKVVWTVEVTDAYSENDAECTGEPGSGFFNTATLIVGDREQDAEICIPVEDRVYPLIDKTVVSSSQDPETGDWTIEYDITVTLDANEQDLSAEYDLSDELLFGGDIEPATGSWATSASWVGEGDDGAFEADGTAVIATDKTIDPGDTHTYTVTVEASVTQVAVDDGTTWCYPDSEDPSGGFLNTALLTSGGVETEAEDCTEPVLPEIDKVGGVTTDNGDGTWDIEYFVTVTYPESDLDPLPGTVAYDLLDAPELPEGVELDGTWEAEAADGETPAPTDAAWVPADGTWTVVDDGELTPENATHTYRVFATVSVTSTPVEEPSECLETEGFGFVIWNVGTVTSGGYTNDDDACQVVQFDDVGIEKTTSGLPVPPEGENASIEPGDTFEYVLTVTNHGSREAVDVVVTDPLNERLEVTGITLPAGWVNDNQPDFVDADNVLSVSTASMALGEVVEIRLTVTFTALEQEPVEWDHDGDPATPPILVDLPPVVGDDELPETPVPLDELFNEACVAAEVDSNPDNNCDDVTIETRDIAALVYTRCVNDAPLLGWVVIKSAALADEPILFTWRPVNEFVTPETDPTEIVLEDTSGSLTWSNEIAWPGADFTPSGISIDYPGWRPLQASDYVPGGGFINPADGLEYAPEDAGGFVFNGLILDPSELDYSWRYDTVVTLSVNPELTFTTSYPPATPDCFVARHTEVEIEKTASVEKTEPGESFTYDLEVENVSTDAAADGVVVTDVIPADIKITGITWPGEGDDAVFPNWESCLVTGQDATGYGGNLECVLFGPLQPQGSDNGGATAAPTITLEATVDPQATASVITNVAVVDYHTFGDPDDPGRDSDDATVLLSSLPATGGSPALPLVMLGFLALLAGATTLVVLRRRRGEARPQL